MKSLLRAVGLGLVGGTFLIGLDDVGRLAGKVIVILLIKLFG